jgi:transposase InsO family protein
VYLDDIIIHSRNLAEHAEHLEQVLQALRDHGYCCTLKKCCFGLSSVPYLGHVISGEGLAVDPAKTRLISEWPVPSNINEVRTFVGMVQYCKRFLPNLARLLTPITALTAKDRPFVWTPECQTAFTTIKHLLVTAPVLAMPDPSKPFQLYSDASVDGTGGILMQDGRVIAYTGRKFTDTQRNWTTTEQELYALVSNFETWRCYLEGATTELFTDHHPLIWICTQPALTRKQTRWVLFLQRFRFELKHIPGKVNPADPVSRAPHLRLFPVGDTSFENYDAIVAHIRLCTMQTAPGRRSARISKKGGNDAQQSAPPAPVLPPPPARVPSMTSDTIWDLRRLARGGPAPLTPRVVQQFPIPDPGPVHANMEATDIAESSAEPPVLNPEQLLSEQSAESGRRELRMDNFLAAVRAGYQSDPFYATLNAENLHGLTRVGEYWFKENALALPDHGDVRQAALFSMHDAPWAGHVGRNRMLIALKAAYWWKYLDRDARKYVETCDSCQRNKPHHSIKENLLAPLPVPERPFQTIGIDFITSLPVTPRGYDAIAVIVCHFTKLVHYVPCHTSTSATEFATLFRKHFFRLHGMPQHVVSDRGGQFVSDFWGQLCTDLGVKLRMTSAHQPSTDGQVERANKVVEEMLRAYVSVLHTDWDEWVDVAEFATNKANADAHGMSPFSLVYHHDPLSPPEVELLRNLPLREGRHTNGLNPVKPSLKTRAGREYCVSWVTRFTMAKRMLQQSKDRMRDVANRKRTCRAFEVDDMVMLSTKTYQLKKPNSSEKFLPLFVGPFRVVERIGASAYRIELPASCKVHPVVHVSKLWTYRADPRTPQSPPPILLEDREHFEVLDILDERGGSSSKQYLVQWKGKDVLYNTWEPETNLSLCSELLERYQERKHCSEMPLMRRDCYTIRVSSSIR